MVRYRFSPVFLGLGSIGLAARLPVAAPWGCASRPRSERGGLRGNFPAKKHLDLAVAGRIEALVALKIAKSSTAKMYERTVLYE